jgi:hypothetical protein
MFTLKGMQELREHVPDLRSPTQSVWIAVLAIGVFSLTTIFFVAVKRYIPDWSLDGQVILITIGFLLLRMFYTNKKDYVFRYGELAYRNAFIRFALPGLAFIFAAVAHITYIPGPTLPHLWWVSFLPFAGWYFVLVGAALWIRSGMTFGLDNLTMLSVYQERETSR